MDAFITLVEIAMRSFQLSAFSYQPGGGPPMNKTIRRHYLLLKADS